MLPIETIIRVAKSAQAGRQAMLEQAAMPWKRGTPERRHNNLRSMSLGEESLLLTRGERKRVARALTIDIIRQQQANPDLLAAKFLSAAGRRRREEQQRAAQVAAEAPAKPKRTRKPKAAA